MKISPFKVHISDASLADLKSRIEHTRWPDSSPEDGWSSGTSLVYLQQLAAYWATTFSWRQVECHINSYPNFIAEIDGFDIHFIYIKGKSAQSLPMIITHGWPGSFLEMLTIVPYLIDGDGLTFDLVIPSIPGFGFSGNPGQKGCNSARVAELWHQLMSGLGYTRYAVQGGDVGAGIGTCLAMQHPEAVIGLHLNYIPGSYKPHLPKGDCFTSEEIAFSQTLNEWLTNEGAYSHLHGTKPQTLAYGLNDSPVGLAAWILEKNYAWSGHDGYIESVLSKDELLANITLYWFTQTLPSSIRLYRENRLQPTLIFREGQYVSTPVAFIRFPKELPTPPRSYVERGYNIRQWTQAPTGGHFAAWEQPRILSDDIRQFFKIQVV
ncbi:epoxide hydrolase family protein [Mucilaginibacter paludis]|uniref:Epoxide hydrolase domain protein n=1 Tax=Mucilaginibacter paludis DSM 18603 TaxID=714943 RepID=H1Y6A1_9SPHI|nr:epoxide hydrolase family protein [Mucilaginibacter paludis]EHQ24849.1 Epoxide hydrolase domain protein [Mucilaginibacter paludis DSM 18603]